MRKLYWIKFINAYTQREKESWRVYKRNYENSKLIRQILVVYLRQNIFIWCIKFWIYEILLGQLKLVSTFFIFVIKIKLLKNYQNSFYFTKKASLSSTFSSFCTSFLLVSCFSWPLLVLLKKLVDDKYQSLWHQYVPKLDFKNADSLIYGELKFWFWYLVNW